MDGFAVVLPSKEHAQQILLMSNDAIKRIDAQIGAIMLQKLRLVSTVKALEKSLNEAE